MQRDTRTALRQVEIGERLRNERQSRSLSLSDVAGEAGVSVATLSRIENNKQTVDLQLFLTLVDVLGVQPSAILESRASRRDGHELVRELAALPPDHRAQIFIAAARKERRGTRNLDLHQRVDALVASIDMLRDELMEIRKRVHRKR